MNKNWLHQIVSQLFSWKFHLKLSNTRCRPADTFFPQFDRSEYTEESSVQAESFNGRFVVLARR